MAVALRLARFAGLALTVVVLNFVVPRLLPGSPAAPGGDDALLLPAAAYRALVETYHLDLPTHEQFGRYIAGLVRGDMGFSLTSHRPVAAVVVERLLWTLFLVGGAVVMAAALGGLLGWAAAWHGRARCARIAMAASVGVGALPEFLVAMLLIVLLASRFQIFPSGGALTPFVDLGGWPRTVGDAIWHATLPGLALVAALAPSFALLVRNALVPVMGERYLATARAKGLPERRVVWHALRNALPPVATLFGLRLGAAVAGAAVVERVFAYPGMGSLLFEAIVARDYPLMQGVFLVSSLAVLTINTMLDLLSARLDPRTVGP